VNDFIYPYLRGRVGTRISRKALEQGRRLASNVSIYNET
jgi:hypothetical protein